MAVAAALALASCGRPEAPPPAPPAVTVANPVIRTVQEWDEYTGRFVAIDSVEVRPRVTGYLDRVHFRDGQIVKKGALLFTIDRRPLEAERDRAVAARRQVEAQIALARANVERGRTLLEAEAISQEEYDQRQEALAQAEAALAGARATERAAEIDLAFTEVRAPIGGRVSDTRVDPGNLVQNGETILTTVVSLDPIHFEFIASEQDYLRYVRLNEQGSRPSSRDAPNPVLVKLEDETDFAHRGRMDFVDNAVDPGSGTIRGRAIFDNPGALLIPGMFARMRLLGSGEYQAVLIPDAAINSDQSQKFVWVVSAENEVEYRPVTLGPIIDGLRVVRTGLSGEDRIIVKGLQRAFPGQKVTPETAPPPPAPTAAAPQTSPEQAR